MRWKCSARSVSTDETIDSQAARARAHQLDLGHARSGVEAHEAHVTAVFAHMRTDVQLQHLGDLRLDAAFGPAARNFHGAGKLAQTRHRGVRQRSATRRLAHELRDLRDNSIPGGVVLHVDGHTVRFEQYLRNGVDRNDRRYKL